MMMQLLILAFSPILHAWPMTENLRVPYQKHNNDRPQQTTTAKPVRDEAHLTLAFLKLTTCATRNRDGSTTCVPPAG